MANYIDGFAFPVQQSHLNEYQKVAVQIAEIWKEYGAIAYFEYVGEDLELEGTRTFPEVLNAGKDEAIIFGWVVFDSKESRDRANEKVPMDPRMTDLVAPLIDPARMIFNAKRMVYGGFRSLV